MTITCQTVAVTLPTTLSAQNMTITPAASPCQDPCTVMVEVTWMNNTGSLLTNQTVGITVDGNVPPNGSTVTGDVPAGQTIIITFTVTGLIHSNPNYICPTPN